jgi:uncharacterized protein (AIM24 family)
MVAFGSSFPGMILPFDIEPGKELIVQKSGFLASEVGVELSMFFQKKLSSGLFGGEGFIMQRLSGQGKAFLEIDGYCKTYDLGPGEKLLIDTGYLAAMEPTVQWYLKRSRRLKTMASAEKDYLIRKYRPVKCTCRLIRLRRLRVHSFPNSFKEQ